MNRLQKAEQFRRALQMFAASLSDDAAMEVSTVFPVWEVDRDYKANDLFVYGENGVGDPQLYRVLQDHRSQLDWTPDATPSLYKPVGVTQEGYPEWSQPVGASDAYMTGDIVSYNGTLYISTVDNNVWAPGVYGWNEYN